MRGRERQWTVLATLPNFWFAANASKLKFSLKSIEICILTTELNARPKFPTRTRNCPTAGICQSYHAQRWQLSIFLKNTELTIATYTEPRPRREKVVFFIFCTYHTSQKNASRNHAAISARRRAHDLITTKLPEGSSFRRIVVITVSFGT